MKLVVEYGFHYEREEIEIESLTITGFLISAGDMVIAESTLHHGQFAWKAASGLKSEGKLIGWLGVE